MKKATNIFEQLNQFEDEFDRLENKLLKLELRLESITSVHRSHLIRVKNQEDVSDDFIAQGRSYQDLSPEKAWRMYSNKDFDFVVLDVSSRDYSPLRRLPEALHIPWEEFFERSSEIDNQSTPILVISEDGTKSILACEFLVKRGFYNCNNVSGGYLFWKGFQRVDQSDRSA